MWEQIGIKDTEMINNKFNMSTIFNVRNVMFSCFICSIGENNIKWYHGYSADLWIYRIIVK